jgi:hypothetical protein
MELILTESLKKYIKKNNKTELTIDLPMRKVCCSGPYIPYIRFGKPKKDGYKVEYKDNCTIYVNTEVKYSKSKIHIGIRKFLFAKEVYCFDPDTVCVCGGYVKD